MSLAIIVKVPEGLVLAAESRLSFDVPHGDSKRLVTFDNATKLLQFDDYSNFGAVTFNIATIGTRTAASFVPEFVAQLKKDSVGQNIKVKTFAKKLAEFYNARWQEAMPDTVTEKMYFVVGGFETGDPHAKVYHVSIPSEGEPEEIEQMTQFNSVWGGQTEIVQRIINGYDSRLGSWIKENVELSPEKEAELSELAIGMEQPIVYAAMALQDAINLAESLIRITIDIQSLSAGLRGVGGAIDVAIITKEGGFSYIQKKTLAGKLRTERQNW